MAVGGPSMSARRRPAIFGLDRFGHSLSTIGRLGDRLVTVTAHIPPAPYVYPGPSTFRRLLQKTPAQRLALDSAWRLAKIAKLTRELPAALALDAHRVGAFLAGLRFTMYARDVRLVVRLRHAERVEVTNIAGIRPRARGKPGSGSGLFAVKGRLAVQWEGQTTGLQSYEDRVVVVAAPSVKVAAARVAQLLRSEESPVLMSTGHFMRRHFDGIVEVLDLYGLDADVHRRQHFHSKGTEVWYELRRRRIPKGQVWRPARG